MTKIETSPSFISNSSSGTATILANITNTTVTHNLGASPKILSVLNNDENGIGHIETNITANAFTINLQVGPASNAVFYYYVAIWK